MGFSNFMGLMGGMARAGEQVADRNLTLMDAAGVAQAKEAAQIRLEQRTVATEAAQHTRNRDEAEADRATALVAAEVERKRARSPEEINAVNAAEKLHADGSLMYQDGRKDKDSHNQSERITAEAHKTTAESTKAKNEQGKQITEAEMAARVTAGKGPIDTLFGVKLDAVGKIMNPEVVNNNPAYFIALARNEQTIRGGTLPYEVAAKIASEALADDKVAKKKVLDGIAEEAKKAKADSIIGKVKNFISPDKQQHTSNAPKQESANVSKIPDGLSPIPDKVNRPHGTPYEKDGKNYSWNADTKLWDPAQEAQTQPTPTQTAKINGLMNEAAPAQTVKPKGLMDAPPSAASASPLNNAVEPTSVSNPDSTMNSVTNERGVSTTNLEPAIQTPAQKVAKSVADDAAIAAAKAESKAADDIAIKEAQKDLAAADQLNITDTKAREGAKRASDKKEAADAITADAADKAKEVIADTANTARIDARFATPGDAYKGAYINDPGYKKALAKIDKDEKEALAKIDEELASDAFKSNKGTR